MGPRPNGRGNANVTVALDTLSASLQWGRDLTVAEIRSRARLSLRPGPLQWGRDLTVAEIAHAPDLAGMHTPGLQWGRDLTVAEI